MARLNKACEILKKNALILFNCSSKEKMTADIFKKKSINL